MGAVESLEPTLIAVAARCLRVRPEGISPAAPLARYGLDSLNAVELSAAIGDATGIEVGEDWLLDAPSIRELAQRILGQAGLGAERALRLARIRAHAELEADLDPLRVPPAEGRGVLLTGANGFLGAHLVGELLRAGAFTIVAPVRAASDSQARLRVEAALAHYGLDPLPEDGRVQVFAADIARPAFGLDRARYESIAHEVHAVLHCAAAVSWTAAYEALREPNVETTRALLHFACTATRKRFHFVSSAAACYSTRGPAEVHEDGAVADLDGMHLGYAQSKWAAERLVAQAHARGLPSVILRPALICGHSESGAGNDEDLIALLVRGCVALGHAPDLDWALDASPVDSIARAVARNVVAAGDERVLHLRNPRPAHWTETVLWLDLRGHRVALEPFADWIERVRLQTLESSHPLHRLRAFLLDRPAAEGGRYLPQLYANPHVPLLHTERADALRERLDVQCPRLGAALLERYVDRWTRAGLLPSATPSLPRKPGVGSEQWNAALESALRAYFGEPGLRLIGSQPRDLRADGSILGELASWRSGSGLALHARRLELVRAGGRASSIELVVKPKEPAARLIGLTAEVAARCDPELAAAFEAHGHAELAATDARELALYAGASGALRARMPVCFGTIELGGVPVLLLEHVRSTCAGERADAPWRWSEAHIGSALDGAASVHGQWLGREAELAALHVCPVDTTAAGAERWMNALSSHAQRWFEPWMGAEGVRAHARLAAGWRSGAVLARNLPQSLVHHDFNSRNLLLRATPLGPRLCAFDWELAVYALPQRDVVELLCFVLDPDSAEARVGAYLEHARLALEQASDAALDAVGWRAGVRFALADFGARRLPMYCIAHRFRPQPFLERVARTWWRLARHLGTAP